MKFLRFFGLVTLKRYDEQLKFAYAADKLNDSKLDDLEVLLIEQLLHMPESSRKTKLRAEIKEIRRR